MKKALTICTLICALTACTKDLEKLNVNIKDATTASGDTFFANATKEIADLMQDLTYGGSGTPFTICRLFAQQISCNTYNEGSNYYATFSWDNLYQGALKNLDEGSKMVNSIEPLDENEAKQKINQLALIEIMEVYTYARLVEAFGNVPYTEALNIDNVNPKYDDAETVYTDLINRLNAAIANLDESGEEFGKSDLLYGGKIASWKKFANSMKLQMGLRIIDAMPDLGKETVIAASSNVFTTNEDIAQMKYLEEQPNTNPLWVDLAVGNRQDFIAAAPLVDYMNTLKDPRRDVYFTKVNNAFVGAPYGQPAEYKNFSHFGDLFYTPIVPSILLDYSTVEFLLAEAAERGIIETPADAEAHYNAAITASFDYYGVSGAADYLKQPSVDYKTAQGAWQQKIGMQKWIALFNQGYEAWTEYRRLDYPKLQAPPNGFINVVPRRLLYPTDEQTLNGANWQAASDAIGGDVMTTKLFWDVN